MLDRKKSPLITMNVPVHLPMPKEHVLDNGIRVYEINKGTQELVKIEVIFDAGRPFEQKKLAARATADQLKEGTTQNQASTIAEHFDYYGSTLSIPFNLDTSNIILYSLNKHIEQVLPLFAEILLNPSFPQQELDTFIHRNQQRLSVDLTKNDVVAYRKITELIFGNQHPYGYNSYSETYAALNRSDLISHYENNYIAEQCRIFVSGKVPPNLIDLLNRYLGQQIPNQEKRQPLFETKQQTPQALKIEHPNTVQTALRIGRGLFNRHHEDYIPMYVLNTILGGYFGSRLMTNIREDKGYTYNIYSMLDSMHLGGCFYIGTEVSNEFVPHTLEEIYKEVALLQEEPVKAEELEMVKNYLIGNFLTLVDGPFNMAEVIKAQILEGLPAHFFQSLVEKTRSISATELQALAQKYFNKEDLWEVIVGS